MSKLPPPPITSPIIDSAISTDKEKPALKGDGNLLLPWINWFNQIYTGDRGSTWTPTFVSLTEAGGSATISGRYYRIIQNLAYFAITIVPVTSVSATAGATYCDNFPLDITGDGACLAVTGGLGSQAGMNVSATNRIFIPALAVITNPVTIVGIAEVR